MLPLSRLFVLIITFSVFCAWGISAVAQSTSIDQLPTDLRQRVQKRMENQGTSRNQTRSKLDASRRQGDEQAAGENEADDKRDSPTLYGKGLSEKRSAIEKAYADRLEDGEDIRQFGYGALRDGSAPSLSTGSISSDYRLGVGDEVIVVLRGQKSATYRVEVDREGRIVLPELDPVMAAGRRFETLRQDLKNRVQESFLETECFVSLGRVRNIAVQVTGEVRDPGRKRVTGLSTVVDALGQAGGISKTGSLRRVKLVHEGQSRRVDLYALLTGEGSLELPTLSAGDRIVVPAIDGTVAVAGAVKRSGIYELPDKAVTVEKALALAGGPLRATGFRLLRLRTGPRGNDRVTTIHTPKEADLRASDILMVLPAGKGRSRSITIKGHVAVSGLHAVEGETPLGEVVSPSILGPTPYMAFAALRRKDSETYTSTWEPVNLSAVLQGRGGYTVTGGETLVIFSQQDIAFLNSRAVQRVLLRKKSPTRCAGLQRLAGVVASQGQQAFPRAPRQWKVSAESITQEREKESEGEGDRRQSSVRADSIPSNSQSGKTDADTQAKHEQKLTRTGAQQNCPEIFQEFPNLLPYLLDHAVVLSGEVRDPGLFPVVPGSSLARAVVAAGGTSSRADMTRVAVSRADIRPGRKDQAVNAEKTSLANIALWPRDRVRVAQQAARHDSGVVELGGAVKRPGVYTIRKDETLLGLLERAGGLTEQAYPLGTVFTRERVRERERKLVRSALGDMYNQIIQASTRVENALQGKNIAPLLKRAERLLTDKRNFGRIVVEADPAVLRTKPEKDILLQGGDSIYVPKRPSHILVTGQVLHGGAQQFTPGATPADYIDMAGGMTEAADEERVYAILPNGRAKSLGVSYWNYKDAKLPPGSSIVVPRELRPFELRPFLRDAMDIISKAAVTAASLASFND